MAQGYDGELVFNTRVDTEGFERGTNTMRSQTDGLRNAFSSLGKYFSAALIVRSLVNLGKQAVETASDLQEVQNVVDTSFGDMAYKIEKFSESCIEMYGISELTAKQTASTFMAMAKGMGLASDQASDMAVNLTARMGDMASFFNQTSEITSTALNGIYTGETEALKKFGVVMTEVNLQQYAYEHGITKAISKMTQAEKVQLRYNYVMQQTSLAQGDFAKTSDGWANSTRVATERFKELLGVLGNGLLQVLTPALNIVNNILSSLIGLANTVSSIFSDLFGTAKSVYTVSNNANKAASGAADGIGDIGDATKGASKQISKNLAPFDELNQTTEDIADNTSSAGSNISDIADSISTVKEVGNSGEGLGKTLADAKDGIDGLGIAIIGLASTMTTYGLIKLFSGLAGAVGAFTMSPAGLVAIAVGALAMLGAGLYEAWKKAKETDLENRFGDITLSLEEMKDAADTILDNGTFERLSTVTNEWADLSGLEEQMEGAVSTLNKINWKVGVGIELTAEDQEQYKQAIKTYIESAQKYASEQKEAVLLSLDFLMTDGDTKTDIMTKTNEFYSSIQGELDQLGKKLSDAVTDAWEDGLLTIDETEKIQQIQGQINNIMQELSKSEYNANLELIKMKFSGVDLTADTYKELEKMIIDTTQGYIDDYDDVVLQTVASLDTQLRAGTITTEEYDKAIADIKKKRLENIGTVTLNATRFSITSLTDAFEKECGKSIPKMKKIVDDTVDQWINEEAFYGGTETLFQGMAESLSDGFETLDGVALSNFEDLLKFLKPTKKQLEEIKAECEATGEAVPQYISDGLSAVTQMEAMTGNVDSMYYMLGVQIGKSPERTAAINKALKAGKWIPQKVIEGMNAKDAKIASNVEELFSMLGVTAQQQSTTLNETLSKLGEKAGNSMVDGLEKLKEEKIKDAISGIVKNIQTEIDKVNIPGITIGVQTNRLSSSGNGLSIKGFATGTVVPANYGKFLGVLGDNTRETEVVSPLSTMKQAFKEAIAESGNVNNGGIAHFTLNLNGRNLLEGMVEADDERSKSTGYKLLNN